MHCKHCILYTPSAVTWCRSSVSQNIHFRWKSTHYNNPFHKKHRILYAEVDRYTISIKRFKLMCTFEGLLVMINLELLIHFPHRIHWTQTLHILYFDVLTVTFLKIYQHTGCFRLFQWNQQLAVSMQFDENMQLACLKKK